MATRKTVILNSVLAIAVAGVGVGGYSVLHGNSSSAKTITTTNTVATGSVSNSVSATGNIAAVAQADLSFDSAVASNLVTDVFVKVGDRVTKGQVLAKLDDRLVQSALLSAQASLASAQQNFDKAKAGLTADELAQIDASDTQAAVSLANAQAALDNAKTTADQDVVTTAETVRQAELALTNAQAQADRDIATAQTALDQATANYAGPKATADAALAQRDADQAALDVANANLTRLLADKDYCDLNPGAVAPDGTACVDVPAQLAAAQKEVTAKTAALTVSQAALDKANTALIAPANALTNATNSFESTKLKSKQSVDNATNSVINAKNNQISTQNKDQQSLASAQRSLESAQASYASTTAANRIKRKPVTDADVASQQIALINAQNALVTAQKNAGNTSLIATIGGTVAVINGKVGSAGSATATTTTGTGGGSSSNPFVTITDVSGYEVKVGYGEADATKVKAGQTATMTVDALSGARLSGTVRTVDTTSTLVSNVVTYYAYITITQVPTGVTIQPGMTASVSVAYSRKDNVLVLPTAAVTSRATNVTLHVATDPHDPKSTQTREVVLGQRGDSTIEIVSGLNVGDVVVTTRSAVSTSQTVQNNTGGQLGGTQTGAVGVAGAGAGAVVPGAGAAVPGAGAAGNAGANRGGANAGARTGG